MRTHGAEHAAALPVRAAAPEEGDEDGADGGDEEEGRCGAVDVHRAVRLWGGSVNLHSEAHLYFKYLVQ